jgi:hypothetical protein
VTEQGHSLFLGQMLEQPEGELLAVVLDSLVARVHTADLHEFLYIAAAVIAPGNLARQNRIPELLTWAKVRHPDIEPIRGQTAAPATRRQDSEAVAGFDWTVNRLGLKHGFAFEPSTGFSAHQLGIINCLQSPRRPHILGPLLNHNL